MNNSFNQSLRLDGKVALVTGASKGIGQGLGIGLAAAGAKVAVNYLADAQGAAKTCALIADTGGEARAFGADVRSKQEVDRLVGEVATWHGRLDILVNNAARTRFGPVYDMTEEDFDEVVNSNLKGLFFGSVAAARAMGKSGGAIINISSCAVRLVVDHHSIYTMAKGGIEALTRQLAFEFAPSIRVNAIAPGATSTERNRSYDPIYDRKFGSVIPAGRVATVEDYVGPCNFLASDAARFVTGQILGVDGGWTLPGRTPDLSAFDYSSDRKSS